MSESLRALLEEAGFHGHGLDMAVAIAMAESGGHPMSHNTNASTGDNSYGLFQINMLGSLGPARRAEFHLASNNQLFDPLTNAKVAYRMSQGGTNWEPWSTFKSGAYERYLGPTTDTQIDASPVTDPNAATSHDALDAADAGHNFDIGTGHSLTSMDTIAEHHAEELAYSLGYAPKPDPLDPTAGGGDMGGHATAGAGDTPIGGTSPAQGTGTEEALQQFLHAAVAQRGDPYVFGAKGPHVFDCSGLTAWAAQQAGVELPAGAAHQFVALKQEGMLIPVSQAIHTPGALLFHFASEPQPGLTGEPPIAHVAISLGNGKTIEAADEQLGVTELDAGGGRFNYAAVIPGISDLPAGESAAGLDTPQDDSAHPIDPSATDTGEDPLDHSMNNPLWQHFSDELGQFHGAGLHADHGMHHGHDLGHDDVHGGLDLPH